MQALLNFLRDHEGNPLAVVPAMLAVLHSITLKAPAPQAGAFSVMPAPYLAAVTLDDFNALPEESQLALVYAEGAYVATRWQEVYEAALPFPNCNSQYI